MKRLVPSMVIDEKGAWVTQNFQRYVYLGEPSNAVRIFNELMSDELAINWIGRDDFVRDKTLELISAQASMPLSYTGGIGSRKDAVQIVRFGFERIGLTSSVLTNPDLVYEIANEIGRSSVVIKIPTSKLNGNWRVWDWKLSRISDFDLLDSLAILDQTQIGEISLVSVDNNGCKAGISSELVHILGSVTGTQKGYEGGASSLDDVKLAWSQGIDVVYSSTYLMVYGDYDAPLFDYPKFMEERYGS